VKISRTIGDDPVARLSAGGFSTEGLSGDTSFHAARELGDGLWIYTCSSEGHVRPIGYCSVACRHGRREEAERHYEQYLIDSAQYEGRWEGKQHTCDVCSRWTDSYAVLKSYVAHPLCPLHLNSDGLRQLTLV
jgi:hypothetical protein